MFGVLPRDNFNFDFDISVYLYFVFRPKHNEHVIRDATVKGMLWATHSN